MTALELREKRLESISDNARLAAQGDETAFSWLIEESEGMLYRVCRSILHSEADCADAVQETVITAWRRIGQLRNGASFPAWLARICVNRCYRLARSRKAGDGFDEPQTRMQSDARLDVESAMQRLPRELKLAISLYYFEDWGIKEIARASGVFEGTVKSRLHRARKILSDSLIGYKEEKRDVTR